MTRLIPVYNKTGQPTRQVLIPGRDQSRSYGRINFQANQATRNESDWGALQALIEAGNVSIEMTSYEIDVVQKYLPDRMLCGQNVTLETAARPPDWDWDYDGVMGQFLTKPTYNPKFFCVDCQHQYANQASYGDHRLKFHEPQVAHERAVTRLAGRVIPAPTVPQRTPHNARQKADAHERALAKRREKRRRASDAKRGNPHVPEPEGKTLIEVFAAEGLLDDPVPA